MKAPLSWIKDYVDLSDLNLEEIAQKLTMIGLEVEGILLVGLAKPEAEKHEFKYEGLSWPADKFVVAEVTEVLPHPNAEKLVLCQLSDGLGEHIVLTGAPNLYPFKGMGKLSKPLKVAYAREGAELYDGHQPGQVLTKLKPATIRGVKSTSMICSEKELGISAEHEGVIILDDEAPTGMPLATYMGDAVFDIAILPNMTRDSSIIGIARELAAATRRELTLPASIDLPQGNEINEKVSLKVENPTLNPRFMLGMIEGANSVPSPYWVRRRLSLAGMRPIDALVDATNYTMLDTGEPLHAFDYDLLRKRAAGRPTIITRTATVGEKLITLDGIEQPLDESMELVCDTVGPLSLAGIMGGTETGVNAETHTVLVEAASWNFINIRKTAGKLKISTEASYRFSRNVHPGLASLALKLCLTRILAWSGGRLVDGTLDEKGQWPNDPIISLSEERIAGLLGVEIPMDEVINILTRLGFSCQLQGDRLVAQTPPIRTDIEEGFIGEANLIEEISRIYGYDRIPATRLKDELPPQRENPCFVAESTIRDILVSLGLQETVAYRQTSPQRESKLYPQQQVDPAVPYVRIINPITPDRTVMRRSSLATMLELLEYNCHFRSGLAMFELGPVFLPLENQQLPFEARRLSIGMTGTWEEPMWQTHEHKNMDFFNLKGVVEGLLNGLHINEVIFQPSDYPAFHPGKCAEIVVGEKVLGVLGELHPLVKEHYTFTDAPVLAAELDADLLIQLARREFEINSLSAFPAVIEDIAVIVDEAISAAALERAIYQAGGKLLTDVRLFDIFRGEKLGENKKSMAYQLTYQAYDRTLKDSDAETIRNRIVRALAREFGAVLRSQ